MAQPEERDGKSSKDSVVDVFERTMDFGRWCLARGHLESALQSFTTAMDLCKDNTVLASQEYKIIGNLGWLSRLQGRYAQALDTLQQAITLADSIPGPPDPERVMMAGELGTVYRQMDRHQEAFRAFTEQYEMAEQLGLERAMCRSIGNLGMANYQRGLQLWEQSPEDPVSKQQATDLIQLAVEQLKERVALAKSIQTKECPYLGHRENIRHRQARTWESVGHGRLSLCYTTLSAMGPPWDRSAMLDSAEDAALQAVNAAVEYNTGALPMARFFYARVLLLRGQTDLALKQLNPGQRRDGWGHDTPAIACCKEPSTEHRGYLAEIVAAGADMEAIDSLGYTALDHAVYGGDQGSVEMVLGGLRAQYERGDSPGASDTETRVSERLMEAKLRKGYREILQGKIRPLLNTSKSHERTSEIMRALRRLYAETLSSNREIAGMFDRLKYLPYRDFAGFGRLPRSSDGLVRVYDPESQECECILFISYRWINTDRARNTPDDEEHTQYRRMLRATEEFLKQNPEVDREKLGIWMDFACVDQDNPGSGVSALPIIIAQCDAVISLMDDEYFERAWCCVEAMMIQAMRSWPFKHKWYQHLESADGVGEAVLSTKPSVYVQMKDRKLTYESDRPKVLFLERQSTLLSRV